MLQPSINPVAKTLYLCDGHIGFPDQKTDLVGLFGAIRPSQYPHVQKHFVIFAQLISGLGQVPFYIDIRYAGDGRLVQMACAIQGCLFAHPGRYLVELHCNGQWVADTTLELL